MLIPCPMCDRQVRVENGADSLHCHDCDTTFPLKGNHSLTTKNAICTAIAAVLVLGIVFLASRFAMGVRTNLEQKAVFRGHRESQAIQLTLVGVEPFGIVELSDDTQACASDGRYLVSGIGRTDQDVLQQVTACYSPRDFGGRTRWVRHSLTIDGKDVGQRLCVGRPATFSESKSIGAVNESSTSRTLDAGELVTVVSADQEAGLALVWLKGGEIGVIRLADTTPVETLLDEAPAGIRLWRDNTGNFTAVAKLLGRSDDGVRLQRLGGKIVTVPLTRLSKSDREHVASRLVVK